MQIILVLSIQNRSSDHQLRERNRRKPLPIVVSVITKNDNTITGFYMYLWQTNLDITSSWMDFFFIGSLYNEPSHICSPQFFWVSLCMREPYRSLGATLQKVIPETHKRVTPPSQPQPSLRRFFPLLTRKTSEGTERMNGKNIRQKKKKMTSPFHYCIANGCPFNIQQLFCSLS